MIKWNTLPNALSDKSFVIKLYLAGALPIYPCCMHEVSVQFIIYQYQEEQSWYNSTLAAALFYYLLLFKRNLDLIEQVQL